MPQFDEQHVKLCGGIIVWDGVTQPEIVQQGQKAGSQKWTLKVVFPPQCPDLQLFDQLANKQLQQSKFRGQLPAGGRMPIGQVQPGEFGDNFPGWLVISFKTTLKTPDVYDENGAPIDPMQFGQVIYTGQKVDVLAHCYDYDAAGNRGIAAGLDAFAVIQSAQAPRLQIGQGVNTASAFGGGGQQQPPQNQGGGYGQPQGQPQGGYQNPNQQPPNGGGYGQPQGQGAGYAGAGGGMPQHGTPNAGTAGPDQSNGGAGQPGYNPQGGYNPNQQPPQGQGYGQPQGGQQQPPQNQGAPQGNGYPNQAHNFLPGQGGHQ